MPTENRSSNTDPRDVFIRLNPLGLGEAELRKDSTGFEDQRTHSDYLLFLAGYRETHPEPQPHADPGEVERLRADLGTANAAMFSACEKLRAQLAEQDVLLREAYRKLPLSESILIRRISAALSASAEPSAPVEIDERADFERHVILTTGRPIDSELKRHPVRHDEYECRTMQTRWNDWQARAALDRKPS
ncbi:hypothetical protein [Pseudomonas asiatica]|uniref:hypothetical protein n=1 Tax=Pseudomonas asiatica TaxID=2219225 RepID=UPI002366496B|nr:hypothetical protein [Pseudomonas asiatica]MDD1981154.1 hypothetical protein [Pseudomonas asiatica]